jgi:hypothetical protein
VSADGATTLDALVGAADAAFIAHSGPARTVSSRL